MNKWHEDLTNIAYRKSYIDGFEKYCNEVFSEGVYEEYCTVQAGHGYTLKYRLCTKYVTDIKVKECSEYELYSPDGRKIFSYNAPESTLHTVTEINGTLYYIYNDNLYGYNVLQLSDMAEYRYFPKASDSFGAYPVRQDYDETFIWTELFYNPDNNILAVHGCYWASPYEVMLYHIPDIMKPFDAIGCPREFSGYQYYDTADKEPVIWNKNELIINYCEAYADETDFPSGQLVFTEEEYMKYMYKLN